MAKGEKFRQAVIVIHGMGEQVPMETVRGFVETVWNYDLRVIDNRRPVRGEEDLGTSKRDRNPTWSKPDPRTGLYETGRITTEKGDNSYYTDFFEYYWAHLVYGTTWEQVRAWIAGLLWRNPFKRVPRGVLFAWIALWVATLTIAGGALWSAWPKSDIAETTLPSVSFLTGGVSLVAAWFVSNILVKRIGDVVRYTQAEPPNIARREEIRRKGVKFLQSLIDQRDSAKPDQPYYDRIVVVAHSLGSIVAYDILSECFAANARSLDTTLPDSARQPERDKLEEFIRHKLGLDTKDDKPPALDVEAYQKQQDAARCEMNKMGGTWPVSDFVTLGSPLSHAEFLMAESHEDLRALQKERILATCPPTLEYDGTTRLRHFSYRRGRASFIGALTKDEEKLNIPQDPKGADAAIMQANENKRKEYCKAQAQIPRWPHHAAVFGYTRWTNIYSQHRGIITGDIVSGPLEQQFGIEGQASYFCGIKDVAVMPKLKPGNEVPDSSHRRRFVSHNSYWSMEGGTERNKDDFDAKTSDPGKHPHHIRALRDALRLGADDLNG
ncbi:hypothetical protein [Pelagimonas sp. KU-00592-HH]|uniref:hypothetical protein n=1 Tax=Pelagimonas sp. KU-00592-HH TaxID=3127651 RepID=UPI00333E4A4A